MSRNRGQRLPAGSEKTNGVSAPGGISCMSRLFSLTARGNKSQFERNLPCSLDVGRFLQIFCQLPGIVSQQRVLHQTTDYFISIIL
jgi:hypothetical protein